MQKKKRIISQKWEINGDLAGYWKNKLTAIEIHIKIKLQTFLKSMESQYNFLNSNVHSPAQPFSLQASFRPQAVRPRHLRTYLSHSPDIDDFVSVNIVIIFMIWDGRGKEIR